MAQINIRGIKEINDFEVLNELKNEINEAIDNRIDTVNVALAANDLSNKPFGYLKECFEFMAPSLYEYKDGKKLIKKYIKTIKENNNLKELHSIYENIRMADKNSDLNFFVENFVSYRWNINKKTLNEDVKKLGDVVAEAFLYENFNNNEISFPEENVNLNYAVEYICENKMNSSNIANYSAAIKIIKEEVEKHDCTSSFLKKNIKKEANSVIENFNRKYDDLNESEKQIVNEIFNSKNSEELFNNYKEKCKKTIEEKRKTFVDEKDNASVKRIDNIIEQIDNKKYSKESLAEDISNIIDITNIFM